MKRPSVQFAALVEPLTLVAALLTVLSSAAAIFSVGPGKVDIDVIWKTDDFGETWTRIVGGMREDAYVNSVREDPNRAGLLYAGTNHGLYISYDDGGSWQELNPDLPDMPITDVIPEHDELAMASHGRGFWVLDNVGPLRQAEAGGQERDRWAGAALPMEAGLNRLRWDLRTDPAATFPGMVLWGVRTMAPVVPPGTYSVRLTVDGRSETTEVEVQRNPWITDVTDEDLIAQYEFGVLIRDKVNEANLAVIEIRRVKAELEERLAASEDEGLGEAGERLRVAASEVEGDIYQVRNRSNQDPLNFPIKVNNRLANLLSMSERGDGRPGSGMYVVYEIMVERLGALIARLEGVWEGELEEVNARLREMGMEEIVVGSAGVGVVS